MTKTEKKELYNFFTERKIYLPFYQLQLVVDEFEERALTETAFEILYDFEERIEYKKYNDKNKGAFVIENAHDIWTSNCSVSIVQIDPKTNLEVARHKSTYAAAKSVGKVKGAGNISKVVNGKGNTVFGFIWKKVDN